MRVVSNKALDDVTSKQTNTPRYGGGWSLQYIYIYICTKEHSSSRVLDLPRIHRHTNINDLKDAYATVYSNIANNANNICIQLTNDTVCQNKKQFRWLYKFVPMMYI